VSAELPTPPSRTGFPSDSEFAAATARYERLARLVAECMTHNECGPDHPRAVCMRDGVCSNRLTRTTKLSLRLDYLILSYTPQERVPRIQGLQRTHDNAAA